MHSFLKFIHYDLRKLLKLIELKQMTVIVFQHKQKKKKTEVVDSLITQINK